MHYWLKNIFNPVHVIANVNPLKILDVYIARDTLGEVQELFVHMKIFRWSSLQSVFQTSWNVSMVNSIHSMQRTICFQFFFLIPFQPENSVQLINETPIKDYFVNGITTQNSFLYFELEDVQSHQILSTNFLLWDKLKNSEGIIKQNIQVIKHFFFFYFFRIPIV